MAEEMRIFLAEHSEGFPTIIVMVRGHSAYSKIIHLTDVF